MQSNWHGAVTTGDVALLARLIDDGQDINSRDRYGQTAIMLAAMHGHCRLVKLLITHHADLDVTAKYGLSALMLAIVNGHTDTATPLIRGGANLNLRASGAPGFSGKTAGELAIERGFAELAETIQRG